MDDNSNSAPLFQKSAEELVVKLAEIGTAESMTMAREARELGETFKAWTTVRPSPEVRIAKIQQLLALNRRVMDFLAQRARAKR